MIGQSVRDDQLPVVDDRPAGVDDVGHVAFTFILVGHQDGLIEPANLYGRIVFLEQAYAETISPHRSHTMSDHDPSEVGLYRRAAVTDLYEFPGKLWLLKQLRVLPDQNIV